jgi:hypothetical protein
MPRQKLGVDIGGVIIGRKDNGTDTSLSSTYGLHTTAIPGAFDALRALVEQKFGNEVYLVSRCAAEIEKEILHWLEHHGFFDRTGVLRDHVRFCRERHEKAGICEQLGITHFVDDRLEVLSHLKTVPTRYLFRPNDTEVFPYTSFRTQVLQVNSWQEILDNERY